MNRTFSAALLAAAACLLLAAPARAGGYTVRACGGDGVNRAFWAFATSGLTAYARCPAADWDGRGAGLVARANRAAGGGRLDHLASAWQIFEAPPGARLESMSFHASSGRASGCWSIGVWGWSGDFHPGEHLWGFGAHCPTGAGGWGWFAGPYHLDLRGHRGVRLGVRCDSGGGCPTDSMDTWTSLKDVAVNVRDDSPPSIALKHGALLGDGWHRGTESAWAGYGDNVGIRHVYGQVDGAHTFSFHDFASPGWPAHITCDYARPRPCAEALDAAVTLNTATVADGEHTLRLAAIDAAGNLAVHDRRIRIDNHAPAAPRGVAVAGGDGWSASNRFDVAWQNPPGQTAPIVSAHWRLCRADGSDCRTASRAGRGIDRLEGLAVPGTGHWTLSAWLADEAGNAAPAHAADPIHLRLDDVAPETPGFDALDPADPRRVALPAGDRHSGLALARIELRPRGGGEWRELPTALEDGGRAAARLPDLDLPDGAYELRAVLRDHAGNQTIAGADRTGRPMAVVLPVRAVTRLRPRARTAARRCRPARRRAGRRTVVRRVCRRARPAPVLRVAFGRAATLSGVLESWQGRPLAGAPLEVLERPRTGSEWRPAATASTDRAGGFSWRAAPGPSRTVAVAYPGDDLLLPARLEFRLLVPAAGTLRARPRRARNGGRVVFEGRLRGRPLPPGGRTVDLQAHYRGAWRTFATPRTDARGRWRHPYRFGATRGRVVYRFRAVIKREAAYPYEHGVTPTVKVVVTG